MGRQELNIDQFVNPPGVQAARREGGSNSREKEGEALCLKKINKTLLQHARQSAREAKKTTSVLCFVPARTVPWQQCPLQRCERQADAAQHRGWFSQQQRDGYCSSAKSGAGSCRLTFYFGGTG